MLKAKIAWRSQNVIEKAKIAWRRLKRPEKG